MKDLAVNRRAHFDYEILETYEAGLVLLGTEVKSVKSGQMNLSGTFVVIRDGDAELLNSHIPAYQPANAPKDYNPGRTRKLLLKKAEISELVGRSSTKGLTIIPLKVYNRNNRLKLLLGLARHKKTVDKRETIKKRDTEREVRRTLK